MNYQKIPGISGRAERDCAERWSIIRPELPAEGVALDIGAAEGYFCKQIAEKTNLLAIAAEKHRGRAAYHRRWLRDRHLGKVVSCRFKFDTPFSARLAATPEWIDVTLMLSVLHWIDSDEMLANIASMSGKVIVEIPDLRDTASTGQKFMERLRKIGGEEKYFSEVTGRAVRKLGTVRAHTYPTRNIWVIEGDVSRQTRTPHINYGRTTGVTYIQNYDSKSGKLIYIRRGEKLDWIPGINLATLAAMGISWPRQQWWRRRVEEAVEKIEADKIAGDLRIHNMIVCRDKLEWIDLDHHSHRMTIFEDIKNMVSEVSEVNEVKRKRK